MTLSSHIAYLKGNVSGRAIYPLSFITIAQIFLKLRRVEGEGADSSPISDRGIVYVMFFSGV